MSRGPGKIQKSILQALQSSESQVQRNRLLWTLAISNNHVIETGDLTGEIKEGYIEDSYVKAFQRALKRLNEMEQIKIQKRKLKNIDEFIKYYPFKTASLEILQLRNILFPHVKSFLEGPYAHVPFNIMQNELYILDKIKFGQQERIRRYKSKWEKIEKRILQHIPTSKRIIRNLWIKLVIKGQQFFIDDRAKYGLAFHTITKKIDDAKEKLSPAEQEIFEEIQNFKRRVFKPQVMKHSRLKSQLYLIGNFNERTIPSLTQEIKEHFLEKEPEIIKALPEHYQPEQSGIFGMRFDPSFSPILDSLINRHVFEKFEFLSVQD